MNAITIRNLKKSFNGTEIFQDFSLDIEKGKITVIFGPNGSGKSTLLNTLTGIIRADAGSYTAQRSRDVSESYIFQNYRDSLLPWRTGFENIALPLEIKRKTRAEIRKRIDRLQEIFGVQINLESYPHELSGGQQQMIAFMRALITEPEILYIDEPFSALDYENNLRLREHLQKYYLAFKPTIILVTHNIEEAVHLADTIIILSKRPTRVLNRLENPVPLPRTVGSLKTQTFHDTKDRVLTAFQESLRV